MGGQSLKITRPLYTLRKKAILQRKIWKELYRAENVTMVTVVTIPERVVGCLSIIVTIVTGNM